MLNNLTVLTHVDDFLCGGKKGDLIWLHSMLAEEFELKAEMLGDLADEQKEITFLGRTIRKTS